MKAIAGVFKSKENAGRAVAETPHAWHHQLTDQPAYARFHPAGAQRVPRLTAGKARHGEGPGSRGWRHRRARWRWEIARSWPVR